MEKADTVGDWTYTEGKSRNVSGILIEMRACQQYATEDLPFNTARKYFMSRRHSGVGRFSLPRVDSTS